MVDIARELCSGVFISVEEVKQKWKKRLSNGVTSEANRAAAADAATEDELGETKSSDSD